MEAAGTFLADHVEELVDSRSGLILVACGLGNNGGDGWVAARILVERGYNVRVWSAGIPRTATALEAYSSARDLEVPIDDIIPESLGVVCVVDCLLGAGMRLGPLRKPISELCDRILELLEIHDAKLLACDVPTGIRCAGGLSADMTVVFHSDRIGFRDKDGNYVPELGDVRVVSLPWPDGVVAPGPGDAIRRPPLDKSAKKGENGRLLIVGGGPYHGAPLLSGLAALRVGADLVHIAMPKEADARVTWPMDLLRVPLSDKEHLGARGASEVSDLLNMPRKPHALLIGPGLGRVSSTLMAVENILSICAKMNIPVVVDADAIHALPFGMWPPGLQGVVTPHAGECRAWLGTDEPDVLPPQSDDIEINAEARVIIRTGSVDRIIGTKGRLTGLSGGHPRMSMGGTGDILAGMVAGLLCRGMPPWPAARMAVWVLRKTGSIVGERLGDGMVPEDLFEAIAETIVEDERLYSSVT